MREAIHRSWHRGAGLLLLRFCLVMAPNLFAEGPAPPDYFTDSAQLAQYIQEALDRSPLLQEALSRYRASLQKVPQVTALSDPVLGYTQFLRSIETRVGPQVNSFSISQKIPWFGKLNLQGQMAVKEAAAQYERQRNIAPRILHRERDFRRDAPSRRL